MESLKITRHAPCRDQVWAIGRFKALLSFDTA
jgi:hypothetical protein